MAYCDGTYWSLVADIYEYIYIYLCLKNETFVKNLAYCDGTYWLLVADIYIQLFKRTALRSWFIMTVRIGG